MKSLHILHSEAATGWGGQEIRVFQESRLLLERGHRVTVVCQPGSPLAERCAGVNHPSFQGVPVRMPRALSPAAFARLVGLVRSLRPDLLHTHSSIDSWLVSLVGRLLRIPVVRSRHVSIPVADFFPNRWLYTRFPEAVITSGEAISDHLRSLHGMAPEQVVSIPAGVDLDQFDPALSGESFRQELRLTADQPLVGKIGVIRGWKGHNHFLDAVLRVREQFPETHFVIAGSGPGYSEIRHKVESRPALADRVHVLGHREDVPEILAALDVLVLASFAGEGTPQVIPQAMAMKTPVVATRVGSVPDLLGGGERGLLVAPGQADLLAEGILKVLTDREGARRRAELGYAFCRKELTVGRMIDQTLEVYSQVLHRFAA